MEEGNLLEGLEVGGRGLGDLADAAEPLREKPEEAGAWTREGGSQPERGRGAMGKREGAGKEARKQSVMAYGETCR